MIFYVVNLYTVLLILNNVNELDEKLSYQIDQIPFFFFGSRIHPDTAQKLCGRLKS